MAGSGPDGDATLADVLRRAGLSPPAAARLPPPRTVFPADGAAGEETLRMEITCEARAVRETCAAIADVAPEPPEAAGIVAQLCAAARRDIPGLAEATFVLRPSDAPEIVLPPLSAGGGDRTDPVVVAIVLEPESIRLRLELDAGARQEGAAFLDRLRRLCLDPRRALL